jgi:2-oxoglutarate ferredoxin oxidoreductase subunit beta
MRYEDGYPEPIGVFRAVERPRYDVMINDQIEQATSERGKGEFDKLFRSGDTWDVA